ncbi:hypothetical protein ACP4OV_006277 [Aristida adscensionis]
MDAMDASRFGALARRPPPTGFGPFDCPSAAAAGGGGAAAHVAPGSHGSFWGGGGAMHAVSSESTNPFSLGLDLPRPLHVGLGPFSAGDATCTAQMDPFAMAFLGPPRADGHGSLGGGGATHTAAESTNPFTFGLELDIYLPLPSGLGPFNGGGAWQTEEQLNPFALEFLDDHRPAPPGIGPFAGGGGIAVPVEHTNPFSFGLDLDLAPFSGGGGGIAVPVEHTNPFSFGLDLDLAPFSGVAAVQTEQMDDRVTGGQTDKHWHVQPAVEEPPASLPVPAAAAPVSDGADFAANAETQPEEHYEDDIDATLREHEKDAKTRPSPDYLETTQGGRMDQETRASLVRWMCELCTHYGLSSAMLHRAVSYADRFLSARTLADDDDDDDDRELHLLGAAAVFAAAKYEDQYAVQKLDAAKIAQYCGLAAATSKEEVVAAEIALLAALDYRLGEPTAHTFVDHFTRRYSSGSKEEEELRRTAHHIADVSLLDYGLLGLRPSAVAAAAIFLARLAQKPSYGEMKRWNGELKEVTGYRPSELRHGVESMSSLMREHGHDPGFDVEIFPMFYDDHC